VREFGDKGKDQVEDISNATFCLILEYNYKNMIAPTDALANSASEWM
jgi:hypothetical protein